MTSKACLVATALVLAACHGNRQASAAAADTTSSGPAVGGVGTAVAALQPFEQVVTAIGIVTARPGRFATLSAPGPTRVAHIFVAPGQRVAEGDSLIAFERAPFDAAARSAETALANSERAYARAVRLVQAGILPQKDGDQAAADLAQAQVAAITARRAQQLATLRAPLAGVVTQMTAVLGAAVDASQPLVEVADVTALDAVFNVSPAQAAQIRGGDSMHLTAGQGEGVEVVGQGSVTAIGAAVDSTSRAVAVRARIGRPTRPLRIGESVFGRIVTAVHAGAVTVPLAALVPSGDGFQIFVVDSGGVAHVRAVTVGARSDSLAEILTGLTAGETVVTTGAYGIEDGTKIVRTAP
jgi:RND family efflux transporter MFP subunit